MACDMACQHTMQMLRSFSGLKDNDHPTSLHMVKQILGVSEAERFEFGWCPKCGWRYPSKHGTKHERSVDETCPRCAHAKYKVSLRFAALAFSATCACLL